MNFTVPTLNEEEVLHQLIWGDFLHLPTPVKLSMVISPFKVNTPGQEANIQMVPNEVLARDDKAVRLWRLTGPEAARLYALRVPDCPICHTAAMAGQNYCSHCGLRLVG